jgi:hypothetical protein
MTHSFGRAECTLSLTGSLEPQLVDRAGADEAKEQIPDWDARVARGCLPLTPTLVLALVEPVE